METIEFNITINDATLNHLTKNETKLIANYKLAKEKKDWETSDKLREEIKKLGYIIEDKPDGPRIKKI
jgi:cysteinyl-tRNA synthetase